MGSGRQVRLPGHHDQGMPTIGLEPANAVYEAGGQAQVVTPVVRVVRTFVVLSDVLDQ